MSRGRRAFSARPAPPCACRARAECVGAACTGSVPRHARKRRAFRRPQGGTGPPDRARRPGARCRLHAAEPTHGEARGAAPARAGPEPLSAAAHGLALTLALTLALALAHALLCNHALTVPGAPRAAARGRQVDFSKSDATLHIGRAEAELAERTLSLPPATTVRAQLIECTLSAAGAQDTGPRGIPCRAGYHAARISCRVGYHDAWDIMPRRIS